VPRVPVALQSGDATSFKANQNDSGLFKYARPGAGHDGSASKRPKRPDMMALDRNVMSTDAKRLLLHRDLTELRRLAVWIEGWAARDLSADVSFAVQVCLEEAVANIMMYSAAQDDPLEIAVEVERTDQALVARIEDNGSAFDPTRVARPPVPASLAQAKVGHLGVHLMRSFAGGMHYERRDSRNRLTMRFGLRRRCAKCGLARPARFSLVRKGERCRARRPRC
jgi:serine/threonine-protein kinase RsbW